MNQEMISVQIKRQKMYRLTKDWKIIPKGSGRLWQCKTSSKLPEKTVENFSHTQNAYTKYKTYRKKFPLLKVKLFDLNKTLSLDLAHVDKLAKYNGDAN